MDRDRPSKLWAAIASSIALGLLSSGRSGQVTIQRRDFKSVDRINNCLVERLFLELEELVCGLGLEAFIKQLLGVD